MKKLFHFHNKNRARIRGFTLVEALVAISIFTLSVLAMMSILADGVADTNYAKQKMIASYLAQEGIEVMRNLRDTCMLYPAGPACLGWAGFESKVTSSPADCDGGNGCYFNDGSIVWSDQSQAIADMTVTACGATCPALRYDSASGKYNYSTGVTTGFTREIHTNVVVSGSEMEITSTVFWRQGSGTYQMTFTENIFNWAN